MTALLRRLLAALDAALDEHARLNTNTHDITDGGVP